jgi:hypothetical protein
MPQRAPKLDSQHAAGARYASAAMVDLDSEK